MSRAKLFSPLAFTLLAAMGTVQLLSVLEESQTIDESNQIVTGYGYLKTGGYTLGLEQPPLLKLLFAVSLTGLNPELPQGYPATPRDGGDPSLGRQFLYHNRVPAGLLLLRGRLVAIFLTLLLGFVLALWTRRWLGPGPGLLALFLYALDPNFLAHGRYIKNDVGAALVFFLATAAWGRFLQTPGKRRLLEAGLALGVALCTKFSALLLLPVFVSMSLVWAWQTGMRVSIAARRLIASLLSAAAVAFAVVWVVYGCETGTLESADLYRKLRLLPALDGITAPSSLSGSALAWVARSVPVPAPSFLRGIVAVGNINAVGLYSAYLFGRHSQTGWWYYPIAVFLLKTPLATLTLLILAAVLAWRRLRPVDISIIGRLRAASFEWFVLAVPCAVYLLAAMTAHLNAGMRHLLPIYPFLFASIAGTLTRWSNRRWRLIALAVAAPLLALESALCFPYYLAFFNAASGGPARGPEYLLDSNIDWGQDARRLAAYLTAEGPSPVCISYFGFADLGYYGVKYRPLPPLASNDALGSVDCLVAVSVTHLYVPDSRYPALRSLKPTRRIGYSIYVYDLRTRGPKVTGSAAIRRTMLANKRFLADPENYSPRPALYH